MQTVTSIQLAVQHQNAGRLQQAEQIYRQILSDDPNNIEANYSLGTIAFQIENNEATIQYFKKPIQANPNIPIMYNSLGNAYNRLLRFNDAVDSYEKALSLKPDLAEAHYHLGMIFKKSGQMEQAVDSYKKAISSKPDYASAHRCLSFAKNHIEYDDTIRAMETIYTRTDISPEPKMNLAFGLGKAFENINEHNKAFDFILEGNRLMRTSFNRKARMSGDVFYSWLIVVCRLRRSAKIIK